MSVKVTTQRDAVQKEKPFPKLMIGKDLDLIIFFIKNEKGVIMWAKPTHCKISLYREDWDMDKFTDYNEPITLQND